MPLAWPLLFLVCLSARADEPDALPSDNDELFWPQPVSTAPGEQRAVAFVATVLDRLSEGGVDPEWLRNTFRPAHLPVASTRWYAQLDYALRDGATGQALRRSEAPHAVVDGPDYTRVVLDGLSLVVRQGADGLLIDRIEAVSCLHCTEPERFVSDVLAAYARPDPGHRLVPTVDLAVAAQGSRGNGLAHSHWLAAMEARNRDGHGLEALLDGATIDKADGREVVLTYADGRADTWTLLYERGVWKLDLDALPADSALRLSSDAAERWRRPATVHTAARERWQPPFQERDGGLLVGTGVIGAHFDPLDDTVIASSFEPDRSMAATFRIDVDTRRVTERWSIPIDTGNPLPTGDWYTHWHTALSPDGARLAVTQNTRLYVLDLESGRAELQMRPRELTALAWSPDGVLLAGELWGNLYALDEPWHRAWLESPALALDRRGDELRVATRAGELVAIAADGASAHPDGAACCGTATGASFHPDGSRALLQCGPACPSAAALVDWPGGTAIDIDGASGTWDATSFSPDGRWFTTHSADRGVVLWDTWSLRPMKRLGTGDVRGVRWSSRADRLLTLGVDGELWMFDLTGAAPAAGAR